MESRISIITLGVKDFLAAKDFYTIGLGFRASSAGSSNIVFLDAGGVGLALYPRDLLAQDAEQPDNGSGFRGVTLAHNVARREDVATVLAQAQSAGAKIVKPAQDAFWGGHSGYFADLDGHLWEVAWNPHFKFRADGGIDLSR
ncbi:MAG: VOC family protein [Deltaproteobacteria bacterium]|nr:VOC family protein [Deltaproteobacteria bacterium]